MVETETGGNRNAEKGSNLIAITENLALAAEEVEFEAVRSQGAGGQNVNKVSTAVQLRFDVRASSLPETYKERLLRRADRRISERGVLILKVQRHRSQEQNREEAIEKLAELIRSVMIEPKRRRATRPTATARRKRMEEKGKRGEIKTLRRTPGHSE
jgi:ribosome-associated protein